MRHLVWVCSVSCGLPTTCVSTVGSVWWCVGGTAANCVQTSAVQWCQKTLYKLSQSQLTTEHSWTVAYSNSTFTAQIMTLTISVLTVTKVDSIGWVWMLSADESQHWGNEWCDIIIGVNAAGVAGVVIPQYLTCRGHPVLMTPNILTSVSSFPSTELLNTASRCHFQCQCCRLPHPSGPSGWSRSHKTDARVCVIYWQPRSCFWSYVNVTPSDMHFNCMSQFLEHNYWFFAICSAIDTNSYQ